MNNSFEIKVANREEIQDALKIRERVFIDEVGVARNLELDDNDYAGTTHILSCVNGKSIGTLRLRYFAGFSKIERVCVLPEYRKTNIASQMINYAIQISQAKGYSAVRAICDERLLPFWKEQENFELIKDSEKLALHGHTFCEIYKKLDLSSNVSLRTPSSVLNVQDTDILGPRRFPLIYKNQKSILSPAKEHELNQFQELCKENPKTNILFKCMTTQRSL